MIGDLQDKEKYRNDKTLLLLGNRFDLTYGLKMSYSDYYKSVFFEDFYKNEHCGDISKISILSDYVLWKNFTSDKWADLELLYDFALLYEAINSNNEEKIRELLLVDFLQKNWNLSAYSTSNLGDCIVLGVYKPLPLDKKYNFLYKSHSTVFKNFHYSKYVKEALYCIFYGVLMGDTDRKYYKDIY